MQAHDFIKKWTNSKLKESASAQSHFNDLCDLLDVEKPAEADPNGTWFTFEKGAKKTGGGDGWADVWRRGCFAWEYKGKNKDLDRALAQLLQYSTALENPPLLIVSDMYHIRINTNWTNTVQQVHAITIDDLVDGATRDLLRNTFLDPEALKPTKTRQALTEDAAKEFVQLAQRLRDRGHNPHVVAHFINRLVFCMFAEDVQLLPDHMFTKMLNASKMRPERFEANAKKLFNAMASGGDIDFTPISWFNGGLFEDDTSLPLNRDDIDNLIAAADLDWSEIDPSILGTLFERGLDPSKRSQLGAHYTDRDKIMQIVGPVVIAPLEAEWAGVRQQIDQQMSKVAEAKARTPEKQSDARKVYNAARRAEELAYRNAREFHTAFIDKLRSFRVLDPACGSGNFLYLSLLSLKDIEHRANLDAEVLGLGRPAPSVGPECVLGIELNPYAAELARVSVWIGEIQWMRRNGFAASTNPILRTLDTIENRDAVMDDSGAQAAWPKADVVVGNPPFLGNKKMIRELGEAYTLSLRAAWSEVSGASDLVTYWFAKAWKQMQAGELGRAGLVTTNSIRGGSNREVLKPIVEGGRIFSAWSDEEWTVEGAAVRVSLICFDQTKSGEAMLDGRKVPLIASDLTARDTGLDLTKAKALQANAGSSYIGVFINGAFEIDGVVARSWLKLPANVNGRPNSDVLKPTVNGSDLLKGRSDKWLIDFGVEMNEADASLYEVPFGYIEDLVKPFRQRLNEDGTFAVRRVNHREIWWRYAESRPGMRKALAGLDRYLVTPMVSSTRVFSFLDPSVLPNQKLVVIPRDDFTTFGILSSRIHEVWTLAMCMWIGAGNDVTYSPTMTFETFPFPDGLTPDIPAADYEDDPRSEAITTAAQQFYQLRENWVNPPDQIERIDEVRPGYPQRIVPRPDADIKELKKRTYTALKKLNHSWLRNAQAALDQAVADAYGWGDDWRAGMTDEDILNRLFALNQSR